jgi:ATP-binding cassette subfamily B multidrug efflux pump
MKFLFDRFEGLVKPHDGNRKKQPKSANDFCAMQFRVHRKPMLVLISASGLLAVLDILVLKQIANVVTSVAAAKSPVFPIGELSLLGVCLCARFFAGILNDLLIYQMATASLTDRIVGETTSELLSRKLEFFLEKKAGTLANQATQLGHTYRNALVSFFSTFWQIIIFTIATIALLASTSIALVFPVLIWILLSIALLTNRIPPIRSGAAKIALARGDYLGVLANSVKNILPLKLYSPKVLTATDVSRSLKKHTEATRIQMRWVTQTSFYLSSLNYAFVCANVFLAAYLWSIGVASASDFSLVSTLSINFLGVSATLMWQANSLMTSLGSISASLESLSPKPSQNAPKRSPSLSGPCQIQMKDVTYYFDDDTPVLSRIGISLPPGSKIALVGASGEGKSTLLSLIAGIRLPKRGCVILNGEDSRNICESELLSQIAYVDQENGILASSIRNNLIFGRSGVSDEEIFEVLELVKMKDAVESYSDSLGNRSLDAQIGEGEGIFSGGQTQRLCIARAVLKAAPIILLDEPTSALDEETANAVIDGVLKALPTQTIVMATHNYKMASKMDVVLRLQDGKVFEE